MKTGYVYILTNKPRGILYIGVTSGIENRLALHTRTPSSFVQKYRLYRLVHLEEYPTIAEAIEREKQLKNWHRDWKIGLIEAHNPDWVNLARDAETSSA